MPFTDGFYLGIHKGTSVYVNLGYTPVMTLSYDFVRDISVNLHILVLIHMITTKAHAFPP